MIMAREKKMARPTCFAEEMITASRFSLRSSGDSSERWR